MVSLRFRHATTTEDTYLSLLGYDGEGNGMYIRGGAGEVTALDALLQAAVEHNDALRADIKTNNNVSLAV